MATAGIKVPNIDRYIIAEQIYNARVQLKLTQQEASRKVGISRQEWSALENAAMPSPKRLESVILFLGQHNSQRYSEFSSEYLWWHHWMDTLRVVIHYPTSFEENSLVSMTAQQILGWDNPAWVLDAETWDVLEINDAFFSRWENLSTATAPVNYFDLLLDPQWKWVDHVRPHSVEQHVATYRLTSAMFGESHRRTTVVKRLGSQYPVFSEAFYNPHPMPLLGPYTIQWKNALRGTENLLAVTWQPWMSQRIMIRSYQPR